MLTMVGLHMVGVPVGHFCISCTAPCGFYYSNSGCVVYMYMLIVYSTMFIVTAASGVSGGILFIRIPRISRCLQRGMQIRNWNHH